MSEALYRKYRPQTFEEVVGQDHIERTLRNALQHDKVSHAYLFCGPRGTGKTTTARLLSKALLCTNGPTSDPDGTCEDCKLIAQGEHPDVYELDAASRTGVENVREEIISRVNYAPTRGRYKVYIIDEVHMLSAAAFNALLKTLEEPPDHVVFMLCTTDPQKVPDTIQSRCQRFDFRRIASEELIARLGAICELEGIEFEGDALDIIAHRAQGGMRDALTSLDQLSSFSDGKITTENAERLLGSLDSSDLASIVEAIGKRDAAACFEWTSEYMDTGADLAQFSVDLADHIRDMYVLSIAGEDIALDITETARKEMESELGYFGSDRLARMLEVLGDLISELKVSTNQRLSFEIALTRMIRPESDLTIASLAERIEKLEHALSSGGQAASVQNMPFGSAGSEPVHAGENGRFADAPIQPEGFAEASAGSEASAEYAQGRGSAVPADAGFPGEAGAENGRMWDKVLSHIKKVSEPYGTIFLGTNAVRTKNGIRIEFDAGNPIKRAYFVNKEDQIRDIVADALAHVGCAGLAFEFAPIRESRPDGSLEDAADGPTGPSVEQDAHGQIAAESTDKAETHAEYADSGAFSEQGMQDRKNAPSDPSIQDAQPSDTGDNGGIADGIDSIQDALSTAFGDGIVIEEID